MRIGIHCPVQGFTQRARDTAAALAAACFLWLASEGPQDAAAYPDAAHFVRLDNWRADETPAGYAGRVRDAIARWRGVPNVLFICGNEPDLEAGHDGERFPEMAAQLRDAWPGIALGNPPLSVEATARLRLASILAADCVIAHSYVDWLHPETLAMRQFGLSYRLALEAAAGKPVTVTEVGVSNFDGINWTQRNDLLGKWIGQAADDGVHACCLYIADGIGTEWALFDIGPEAAAQTLALVPKPRPAPAPQPEPEQPMNLWDAIRQTVDDADVRLGMLMGAAIETGTIAVPFPDQYGGGPGRGPFQIEAGPGGSHTGEISEDDARDPLAAAAFMAPAYESAAARTARADFGDDATYYATIAYRAERPAAMYPADRIARAWTLVAPYAGDAPAQQFPMVFPVDAEILQGSDGAFSHGGAVPGFYAIDWGCPSGTPVRAAANGTVGVTYWQDSNPISLRTGHSIWIDHDTGYSTFSCHLSRFDVATGDRVTRGQVIGLSGDPAGQPNNGYGSGPHLHWEIWDTAAHARVRMEDLRARGLIGPYAPDAEERDVQIDGHLDDAMIERLWYGNATKAAKRKLAYNPESGIGQRWKKELLAGHPLGAAQSGEESDPASGRVIQYFTNGAIVYYTADGSTTVN